MWIVDDEARISSIKYADYQTLVSNIVRGNFSLYIIGVSIWNENLISYKVAMDKK